MGSYIASAAPLEANLMARVQLRDELAFQELFRQFRNRIHRTAMNILKEEQSAEDATQETFMKIYRAADKFRGDSKVGTWINRITVNVCLEIIRKNKQHSKRSETDISDDVRVPDLKTATPFEKMRQFEIRRRVEGAMDRLGSKHYHVVRLHDLEGYTIREIAEKLGVAEGTVKSRLFYGREDLKRLLRQDLIREAA